MAETKGSFRKYLESAGVIDALTKGLLTGLTSSTCPGAPALCGTWFLMLMLLLCDLPPAQCWSPCTRSLTNPSRP